MGALSKDEGLSLVGKIKNKLFNSVNIWQKGQNSLHETIPFSTTLSLDGNTISNSIHIDATANFTLNVFSNIPSGVIRGGVITVTQDATGGRVATFTGWIIEGSVATTVANTTAIYDYEFILGVGYMKLRKVI